MQAGRAALTGWKNFVFGDLHFLGEIHHTSRIHHRRTGDPIFPIPGGIHVSIWI
jgi:hypothetical protein